MNREQLLLLKLMEECDEISKVASKTIQFGFNECKPGQKLTNADRLKDEINDLYAVIEMLNKEFDFNFKPCRYKIIDKFSKINIYAKYSKSLGRID